LDAVGCAARCCRPGLIGDALGSWRPAYGNPATIEPIELRVADNSLAMVADGWHRLAAVVITNIPVEVLVSFSRTPDIQRPPSRDR
jgi:hypothetical protein